MTKQQIEKKKSITSRHLHREFWVLSGSRAWAMNTAIKITSDTKDQIWITDQQIDDVYRFLSSDKSLALVGQETQYLVFDAFSGFNIDTFGLVSGLVRGGGKIILLIPKLSIWPDFKDAEYLRLFNTLDLSYPSRFITRTVSLLQSHKQIRFFQEKDLNTCFPEMNSLSPKERSHPLCYQESKNTSEECTLWNNGAITKDQYCAVSVIAGLIKKKGKHSLVLTAHRGRGKTSALGLAAAQFLTTSALSAPYVNLIVTAPYRSAVTPLFSCAKQQLSTSAITKLSDNRLETRQGSLTFMPPDVITLTTPDANILFVDEAAAIPIPLLEKLLKHYPKIIFSSTVHGYEGTGRGFAIRFKYIINSQRPHTQYYHLHEPIRWAKNDPSEQLIFNLLGLNCQIVSEQQAIAAYSSDIVYEAVSQNILMSSPELLEQVFGLLVLSHYQTKPGDFRILLDAPNIGIHILVSRSSTTNRKPIVLGVGMIFYEGPLLQTLHHDILLGKRRLKGHLLPQAIATQSNTEASLSMRGARIHRIAIHPSLHSKGLGSRLLQHISHALFNEGIDYTGSNFGTTTDLLNFWKKNDFYLTCIGSHLDASSACHSATVVKGLSNKGKKLTQEARQFFAENVPYQFKEALKHVEPTLCLCVLKQMVTLSTGQLSTSDRKALWAYTEGYRLHDYTIAPLTRTLWHHTGENYHLDLLSKNEQTLLIMKIVQGHSWHNCIETLNLTGKKQAQALLRQCYKKLL